MNSSNFHNIIKHTLTADGRIQTETANVNDLLMEEKNSFRDWECWAGIQNITIDNNGDVWRAICKQGEKLGTIYTDFDVANTTVTCHKSKCTCAADLHLSKARLGFSHILREKQKTNPKKPSTTTQYPKFSFTSLWKKLSMNFFK